MSFKFKVVTLILTVSLIPYILIMTYGGKVLREKYYENTQFELKTQLNITIDNMEQYLNMLNKDIYFISELDIMNDIFSNDVDRRISNLLEKKKKDLHLLGNFHLINNSGVIIASSDSNFIFKSEQINSFFSKIIYSPFDESVAATLVLDFDLKNLTKFFENSNQRQYFILDEKNQELYKEYSYKNAVKVTKKLGVKQGFKIVLEQNQKVFLKTLKKYENMFFIALLVGAFIISIIALFFVNHLIKPIIILSNITNEITKEQDYSHKVTVSTNDEIGQLSQSFNKMISGMDDALKKLKQETKNREKLLEEQSKNEVLQELSTKLSRYLSPQVYESIFSGEQDVTLTSKRKKLTIFFSDVVGFTDTTDTMESEDLSELLNDYLNEMTITALKHGATIDKYIGDAIMLFFGDPYSKGIKEDAISCVSMALEMHEKIDKLDQKWKQKGFVNPFKVRMGIHTGYCTVGNFGSNDRLEYTIIGSSVNLASRIESSANPNEILISEETQLLVNDMFDCKRVKDIIPKGFKRSIDLYSIKQKEDNTTIDQVFIKEEGFKLSYNEKKLTEESKKLLKFELEKLAKKFD